MKKVSLDPFIVPIVPCHNGAEAVEGRLTDQSLTANIFHVGHLLIPKADIFFGGVFVYYFYQHQNAQYLDNLPPKLPTNSVIRSVYFVSAGCGPI